MEPKPDTQATNAQHSGNQEVGIGAVARINIPPFWDQQPDIWFLAVESQFELHRTINDDARYAHVLAALPQPAIQTISDIIRNPPLGQKYPTIKAALIKRHTISEERRIDELLSGLHTMGDLGPSQFYRLLEQKAGDSQMVSQDLLKNLWLKRLPETLRTAVAAWADKDITVILPIAEQIWVFAQPSTSSIAETTRHHTTSQTSYCGNPDTARIQQQLDDTQRQLRDLQRSFSSITMGRARSPARRNYNAYRGRSGSRSRSRSGLCFFHRRFGSRARQCTQPCNYNANSGAQSGAVPKQQHFPKHSEN